MGQSGHKNERIIARKDRYINSVGYRRMAMRDK